MPDPYADAIASIESGGRYDVLGPTTRSGDRAYGRYQIMGSNIGPWTQQALGRTLTPEQFLADKDAQDATFKAQFGQYVQKYGPEGAARAWFAGERGMNNPNARDMLGTSVADYAARFTAGLPSAGLLGGQAPAGGTQGIPPAGILGAAQSSTGAPSFGGPNVGAIAGLLSSMQPHVAPLPAPVIPQAMPRRRIDLSALQAMMNG